MMEQILNSAWVHGELCFVLNLHCDSAHLKVLKANLFHSFAEALYNESDCNKLTVTQTAEIKFNRTCMRVYPNAFGLAA